MMHMQGTEETKGNISTKQKMGTFIAVELYNHICQGKRC